MLHYQMTYQLAEQRQAELHRAAAGSRPQRGGGTPAGSLRERTGWTLVTLGLALVGQAAQAQAEQPCPACS